MKKKTELKTMNADQLQKKLGDVENDLLVETSKKGGGGRAFNPGRIRNLKRMRATILTFMRQRESM